MVHTLKFQGKDMPVPGFGAMGISAFYGPSDDAKSIETLDKALSLGTVFWDTAAMYGNGHNESFLGDWFKKNPGAREKVFVASKCGILPDFSVTNSKEHIEEYLAKSTERLGFAPDLYYLHRIEPGRDLKESIGTLKKLKEEGKCKYIGLSECGVDTLRKANEIAHIDALQIEYGPFCLEPEENGLKAACEELGVALVAYSPLGRGILTGTITSIDQLAPDDFRRQQPQFAPENFDRNMRIVKEFTKLADKKGCTPGQLALAWVIAQGAFPIPGTRSPDRLEENWKSNAIDFTNEELEELRTFMQEGKPKGERYGEQQMKTIGH